MTDNDTKTKYPHSNPLFIEAVIIFICACGYFFGNAYYQEPVLTAGSWCSTQTPIDPYPLGMVWHSWLFWGLLIGIGTATNLLLEICNTPTKYHCPYCNKEWEE